MSNAAGNPEQFPHIIETVQTRLETGEADRDFVSREAPVLERVEKLHRAEELDPQMLKLTVTI